MEGEGEAGTHAFVGCSVLNLQTVDGLNPWVNSSFPEKHPRPILTKTSAFQGDLMGTAGGSALCRQLE